MDARRYFLLKRLHSLTGVVPVAGFVVFHLFENSHSVAGAEAFNGVVGTLRGLPYLYLLEIGLLSPIVFHALLGLWLARTARPNALRYPYGQNWAYSLQRITGIILLAFIGYHVWTTRFAGIATDQMFQTLAGHYSRPLVAGFYVAGILSAAFHLSNGLWGFAVAWGILRGQKSMDLAWKACLGLGVLVALMGLNALAGFRGRGVDLFQHEKTPAAAAPAAETVPLPPAAVPSPALP